MPRRRNGEPATWAKTVTQASAELNEPGITASVHRRPARTPLPLTPPNLVDPNARSNELNNLYLLTEFVHPLAQRSELNILISDQTPGPAA